MTVKELIDELGAYPPEAKVEILIGYRQPPLTPIGVGHNDARHVFICVADADQIAWIKPR